MQNGGSSEGTRLMYLRPTPAPRRPRYAARGELGDGDGEREIDEPKEESGDGAVKESEYDCARLCGSEGGKAAFGVNGS